MTTDSEATVFIVDDDAGMRNSLSVLIESVGLKAETFGDAQEFWDSYDPTRCGCLVLDVRMPGMSGLELQDKLAAMAVPLPVIIITAYADVSKAVRAVKAGAVDFIEKPFEKGVLLDSVRKAIDRDAENRRRHALRAAAAARLALLTPREREVMDLLIVNKTNREIAAQLGLTPKTIEAYRARVMLKLQADGVADLVRLAMTAADDATTNRTA